LRNGTLNCPLVVFSAPEAEGADRKRRTRRGEIDRRPVREGRCSARPLRYRSPQRDAPNIMSKRNLPWFWNSAVLARLAWLLLDRVFAAYASGALANWCWP